MSAAGAMRRGTVSFGLNSAGILGNDRLNSRGARCSEIWQEFGIQMGEFRWSSDGLLGDGIREGEGRVGIRTREVGTSRLLIS